MNVSAKSNVEPLFLLRAIAVAGASDDLPEAPRLRCSRLSSTKTGRSRPD